MTLERKWEMCGGATGIQITTQRTSDSEATKDSDKAVKNACGPL